MYVQETVQSPESPVSTDSPLRRRFVSTLGVPFTDGNKIERLRNGDEIFPAMLEALDEATTDIEFLTFVYWTGDIAVTFAEKLAERARAGVRVRVLLDAVGAHPMRKDLVDRMSDAGVEVEWFRPVHFWAVWRLDRRTHRKVLVCDGRVGFTGGVGIADEWAGDAREPSEWRDTHFKITGPAVDGLRAAFFENWAEARRPQLAEFTPMRDHNSPGDVGIQVLRPSSSANWGDAATALHLLIDSARQSIQLSTAYFVPDEALLDRLIDARRRGVNVTLLVPGDHMDVRLCKLGGRAEYTRLMEYGIDIYEYNRSMLHTKLIMIDGRVSAIGSANLDYRSIYLNEELILICESESLTRELESDFADDLTKAEKIRPQQWRRRSHWQRLKESLVRRLRYKL